MSGVMPAVPARMRCSVCRQMPRSERLEGRTGRGPAETRSRSMARGEAVSSEGCSASVRSLVLAAVASHATDAKQPFQHKRSQGVGSYRGLTRTTASDQE